MELHAEDYTVEEMNININSAKSVGGNVDLKGNVNLNSAIKAVENISISGETINANNSIIYSEYGNIVIEVSNVSVSGLIYAPFGTVEIHGQNINLNNIIVIADKICSIS